MKILRSQYMKLRNSGGGQRISENPKGVGKKISQKGLSTKKGKTQLSNAAPKGPQPIGAQRRNSVAPLNTTPTNPPATNIQVLFDHVDETLKKLNVVVEFIDMDAMWLTRVYRTYENELWHRKQRLNVFGTKKWYFYCHLCDNVYTGFAGIKSHLNLHFNYYPYVCKLCLKKYTNRTAATKHLKRIHNITKEYYNDNLTS